MNVSVGRSRIIAEQVTAILVSLAGTAVSLFPNNPNNMTLPSRDSGVFLYIGWMFLKGDIPYRDVWDHKPPFIYFVDALGLTITPNSQWGVWFLQAVFIFATFFLLYRLLEKEFNPYAALGGGLLLASGLLTILQRGNVTEEYALVFQVLCLMLIVTAYKRDFSTNMSFWIGFSGGMAFNFKQTTIGILAAYCLLLLAFHLFQRRSPLLDLASLFLGWIIPSLLMVIYFASQNALLDFWEQAYRYNFLYIGKHEGIRRLIPVFAKGFLYLQNGWILQIALTGWLMALAYVWSRRKKIFTEVHPLVLTALIALPIKSS